MDKKEFVDQLIGMQSFVRKFYIPNDDLSALDYFVDTRVDDRYGKLKINGHEINTVSAGIQYCYELMGIAVKSRMESWDDKAGIGSFRIAGMNIESNNDVLFVNNFSITKYKTVAERWCYLADIMITANIIYYTKYA